MIQDKQALPTESFFLISPTLMVLTTLIDTGEKL